MIVALNWVLISQSVAHNSCHSTGAVVCGSRTVTLSPPIERGGGVKKNEPEGKAWRGAVCFLLCLFPRGGHWREERSSGGESEILGFIRPHTAETRV